MKFNSTSDLDLHKLNECDKITVSCALKDYGCSKSVCEKNKSDKHFFLIFCAY